jgi:RND family efflux transporter MFP subunit
MSENRHSSIGIHGLHEHEPAHGIHRLRLLKRTQRVALLILIVLLVGAAIVIGLRIAKGGALAETANEQSVRYVNVTSPTSAAADNLLRLPGTLQGVIEAPIFARTSGYVTHWYKDIGDQVKQGELLAQIDTPEVAQQLNEAKAALAQSATNLQLAKSTFERWNALRKRDAVSQQELDEKRNTMEVAAAAVNSSKATVQRLQDQLGYSRITAPFSGVITRRNVDIGDLIDAGSSSNKLLFTLVKSDPLRVYVYVPQNYAAQIKVGDKAEVSLSEMPGQVFAGHIVRTAGAIDTLTRTLQVEVTLSNHEGTLLPGSYVQVAIKARESNQGTMTIPGNALLFRPQGVRVALVGADNKVKLQPVVIGRELGTDVELSSGVTEKDRLIVNPSDSLNDGDLVSVVAPKEDAARKPAHVPAAPPAKTAVQPTVNTDKGSAS